MKDKEENAIILDYLPYGYPLEKKMMPIAQAVGTKNFTPLEIVPRKGLKLEVKEIVYIGEGKRDKVYYILGRLPFERITETAKATLQEFIEKYVSENEKKFVEFFNKADPINTRLHQLELLPGFGKKHTIAIIEERKKEQFADFADLKKRISNLPDPKNVIVKRIILEIGGQERYHLFTG